MQITTTPAPKSTIELEIELPPERLDQRRSSDAVRHLVAPHPRPRLPPGQGPAPGPRASARPGRRPRRRGRAPRPGRLPRGARREGDPAADQRRRRGRPGRGGQAARLQGDRPGPSRGQARRLQELQLPARRSRPSTTPGSTRSSRSCATRTRRWPRSRTAARRTATTRSSRSSGRATASRSRAAPRSGCR